MKKVIITCALTGSVPSKEKFPALPITVDEIVNDAIAVYEAGAAVVHVHVRDRVTGKNSHDIEQFREIKETVGAEATAKLNPTMIENVAKGRVAKFLKEVCLVIQEFQFGDEAKQNVAGYLKSQDKDLKIVAYKRFTLAAE